jgi:hypothetical protein
VLDLLQTSVCLFAGDSGGPAVLKQDTCRTATLVGISRWVSCFSYAKRITSKEYDETIKNFFLPLLNRYSTGKKFQNQNQN